MILDQLFFNGESRIAEVFVPAPPVAPPRWVYVRNCTNLVVTRYRITRKSTGQGAWTDVDIPVKNNCQGPCKPAPNCEGSAAFGLPFSEEPFGVELELESLDHQSKFVSKIEPAKFRDGAEPPRVCVDASRLSVKPV